MPMKDWEHLRIPFEKIEVATENFKTLIGRGGYGRVYKGELSINGNYTMVAVKRLDEQFGQGLKAFLTEIQILSGQEHPNLVSLVGYCDEGKEKIIVYEYAARGSLDHHIRRTRKTISTTLTWLERLKICADAARGLDHLHNHAGGPKSIIHRDIKSSNILIDENWVAKITDFGLSKLTVTGFSMSDIVSHAYGTQGYCEPEYYTTGILTKKSDVYSFGIVLFEVLCGRLCLIDSNDGFVLSGRSAKEYFEKGNLDEIIDPSLEEHIGSYYLSKFATIAYRCLNDDREQRPGMDVVKNELEEMLKFQVQNIQHMKIPLEEIRSATLEEIRSATRDLTIPHKPGKVYKADLSHFNVDKYVAGNKIKRVSKEEILKYQRIKSTVAIKSIDGVYGQRTEEQLQMLLCLSHKNLVKLVGFCDEDDGRIHVVYEYASNGSLDEYIHSQHIIKKHKTERNMFPWVMRLQFCLDAARGLNFLHNGNTKNHTMNIKSSNILARGLNFLQNGNTKNHTITHGNIKSSDILISRDGVGMIGDFGLLSTNEYSDTHRLTKEYDVYSFGLVLFEVLSGVLTHIKISEDDPKFLPDIVKRGFNQKELDNVIDPMLRQEFEKYRSLIGNRSAESLNLFANIAYRCFQEKAKGRPTMADVVDELEKAYKYHVESLEQRQEDEDNSKMENLKHLKIPFKEIYLATNGFVDSRMIGWGGFGGVYKAELFHVDVRKYVGKKESLVELYGYPRRKGKVALKRREIASDQGRKEFWKEIDVLSGLNHQNIISLVGFCYEYGEMIIIYDYASNGSFEKYIRNVQNLKWEERLQICIDAAQGLNYLHNHHIIHRDVKNPNILLGDSLEGMIGDVGLSLTVKNTDSQLSKITVVGTGGYVDPKYLKRGILSKQSDMYSFGVVLLEVLCGRFATTSGRVKDRASLVDMAECHLLNNQPSQIIGDYLKKDLNNGKFLDSVKTFAAITHECLHSTETHRLTMADVLKELKKALTVHSIGSEPFSLEEIKSATNHFSEELVIGSGASAKIYKGELSFSKKSIQVAVKRLDRTRSYEEGAFLKEVVKLSRYVHENIITLRGFCEEDNENIIIMDHASNGSLDRHLDKSILTWGIRLKISIGAAKGLNHIHSFEKDQKTVHGDIKSSNILLDQDWKASISDFIVSKSRGTLGYLDPQYSSSGATKEADVYSFGMVLFELLSGRLAIDKVEKYSHPTLRQIIDAEDGVKDKKVVFLAWMAARCFEEKKLEALIFDDIKEQTDAKSVGILSQVAYECLQKDKKKRPTMVLVIQELEKALNIHDEWEWERKVPKDYEKIIKMCQHPVSPKITKKDLYSLFASGILLQNGKVLSLSKEGKVKEMISATMFCYKNLRSLKWRSTNKSRFQKVAKISDTSNLNIQIQINSQFSSLGIIYGVYLVFKFCDTKRDSSEPYVKLKYRTASRTLTSYVAERRDDEWMMIELCRFRNRDQVIDFEVLLKSFSGRSCGSGPIYVDGIEFQPIDNDDRKESVHRLINADSSVNWDQQSTSDFQEIMKRSQYDVLTMTKQELYELLITGVLIDNGEKLFSLSKVNCKKCHMLPPKAVINKSSDAKYSKCQSSATSRFEEVVELQRCQAFSIKCDIETQVLSPDTAYACYLVFQLPENCKGLKCPLKARDLLNKNNKETTVIYLRAPGPVDLYRDKRVPENREDGWMEVRVWDFVYNKEHKGNCIPMDLKLVCLGGTMSGLIICGVEFRPLVNKRMNNNF